jgi:hypothetical protein
MFSEVYIINWQGLVVVYLLLIYFNYNLVKKYRDRAKTYHYWTFGNVFQYQKNPVSTLHVRS